MLRRCGSAALTALSLVGLAAFLCSQPVQAQELGTISGLVTDASGSVIAKAQVAVTNEQTGLTRNLHTN
ncbi:MAG: carboxypeptidase-like regulatory domain-containing protein, partial [Bryobacteraceae bacterium]